MNLFVFKMFSKINDYSSQLSKIIKKKPTIINLVIVLKKIFLTKISLFVEIIVLQRMYLKIHIFWSLVVLMKIFLKTLCLFVGLIVYQKIFFKINFFQSWIVLEKISLIFLREYYLIMIFVEKIFFKKFRLFALHKKIFKNPCVLVQNSP